MIADEMGTQVCSIYLLDPDRTALRLTASRGLDRAALGKVTLGPGEGLTGTVVQEMRSLAVEDASAHPGFRYFPETKEESYKSYLGVPLAMRNRPVGAIVVQTADERNYSQTEIDSLTTIAAQLVGVVENARLIESLDRADEGSEFLEEVRRWGLPTVDLTEPATPDLELMGSPASPGVAMAEAVVRGTPDVDLLDADHDYQGEEAEIARFRDALALTERDIVKIQRAAERETDEEHALIFSSHVLLLNDPVLIKRIEANIADGQIAPVAVYHGLEEFEKRLLAVEDPYIRERVEDIRDLRSRLVGHLLQPGDRGPQLKDRIVVAAGIPPSLVVELKAEGARGLVTERGGATSHGALLARSMGIPAVTGVPNLVARVAGGEIVIVDGDAGRVVLHPSDSAQVAFHEKAQALAKLETEYLQYRGRPAETSDGVRVALKANIGVAADLDIARENSADGVGLYRTEFPFLVREHFPTREEQVRIYSRAYEAFPDGDINFRLLDLGADKFIRDASIQVDRDPFAGYRSIRVLLDHPQVLRDQVQAFALAANGKPIRVLIPLVSVLDEVTRVRELIEDALRALGGSYSESELKLGAMIELPAAVEISRALAKEIDFLSIGTNDLIQYALASDRENSRVSAHDDSFHPAILNMIRRTVEAAHAEGKTVGVCGEIANDPLLAGALIAMGVDSLSLTPSAIPALKLKLSSIRIDRLRGEFDDVLAIGDAQTIEKRLGELLRDGAG